MRGAAGHARSRRRGLDRGPDRRALRRPGLRGRSRRERARRAEPPVHESAAGRTTLGGRSAATSDPMPGDPPNPTELPAGCAFAPRCSRAEPDCEATSRPLLSARPVARVGEVACLHPRSTSTRARDEDPEAMTRVASAQPAAEGNVLERRREQDVRGQGRRHGKAWLRAVDDVSLTVPVRGVGRARRGERVREDDDAADRDRAAPAGRGIGAVGARRRAAATGVPGLRELADALDGDRAQVEERLRTLGVPKRERELRALEYLGRVGLDRRAAGRSPVICRAGSGSGR